MRQQLPEGEYWMYLRKSRADLEAEALGEGETLAKHKRALFRLAKDYRVNVTRLFEEVVSGESLSARPEMMELLRLAEIEKPKGIFVMDLDRLGRGNMQEQGLILDTFQRLETLIITPRKIYDLNDEFDEEYSEFEAFMARKEFKIIKRRLQRGREDSAREGNYIAVRPPYGYEITITDRGDRTLKPHHEQADVVRLVFEWYTKGMEKDGQLLDVGATLIARELTALGIPTYRKNTKWDTNVVLQMLRNPVYIGRVVWKKRVETKTAEGKLKRRYNDPENVIDVQGKHPPIIDKETFDKAQEKLADNNVPHLKGMLRLVNPLAGLIICDMCGKNMILKSNTGRRKDQKSIMCNNKYCDCRSSYFEVVEDRILTALDEWMKGYRHTWGKRTKRESRAKIVKGQAVKNFESELEEKQKQKTNLHNLVERGVYDDETFLTRSKQLADEIKELNERLEIAKKELEDELYREKTQKDFIPKVQSVIKMYKASKEPVHKNRLLKSILKEVRYRKTKQQIGDDFEIEIVPKLPRKQ